MYDGTGMGAAMDVRTHNYQPKKVLKFPRKKITAFPVQIHQKTVYPQQNTR